MDWYYYSTTHENWGKIFKDVLWNLPPPIPSEPERMDCDKYAWITKARVFERYGLSAIGLVVGDTPRGRHAYNMFRSEHGWFLIEPQTGDVFGVGEEGYISDFVIL